MSGDTGQTPDATGTPVAVAATPYVAADEAKWTAREVVGALYRHHRQRFPVLTEVTATEERPYPVDRRCDVLLLGKADRIMVEVKVTRADFLHDVRDPDKQALWSSLTHRRAYAVPLGLVAVDEVPDGWGLLTVERTANRGIPHDVRWARRAPKRPGHYPADLPARTVYALMHRLAAHEAAAKGHGWGVVEEDAAALRAKVARLERDVEVERNARQRADDRAREWRRRYGACVPPACATCGKPLAPERKTTGTGWRHPDADHEAACLPLRETQYEAEQIAAAKIHGYTYRPHSFRWTPGPHPSDELRDIAVEDDAADPASKRRSVAPGGEA